MALELLGRDLLMTPFFQADAWGTQDLVPSPALPVYPDEVVDLGVAAGGDNLRQALILRLLTPVGSLTDLGHASYGSRLHELVGQPYSERLRLQCRAFVLAALSQEARVDQVLSLEVSAPTADAPDTLRIALRIAPVGGGDPLTLGLEVAL